MSASNPTPESDESREIAEALRRDAGRIPEPAFDADLHRQVVSRVRDLYRSDRPLLRFKLIPPLAVVSLAAAAIALTFAFSPSKQPPATPPVAVVSTSQEASSVATVWSYEMGLTQGDAVFDGMLDRDAQSLLPPSSNLLVGLL